MKIAGLFAGIGGLEYGLHNNDNMQSILFCEILEEAQYVLKYHYPESAFCSDVKLLDRIGDVDIVTAGFPCQDLSLSGRKGGINGTQSSLVREIFRLLEVEKKPEYVIIENVANLISLNKGEALRLITDNISRLGYNWAYRLIDPRSFGIPQRRPRFIFIASNTVHPKHLLFPEDEDPDVVIGDKINLTGNLPQAYGFYWTEGRIGIGWAKDSIPPLKCGSSLGLPSAPAIWDINNDFFGTPSIEDAERLQGFPEGWTRNICDVGIKNNKRWKLIGNAVNTKVSEWVGNQIISQPNYQISKDRIKLSNCKPWPKAAFGEGESVYAIKCSFYPEGINYVPILDFLNFPLIPLSLRATLGFYNRVIRSTLINYPQRFIASLRIYLKKQYDYEVD